MNYHIKLILCIIFELLSWNQDIVMETELQKYSCHLCNKLIFIPTFILKWQSTQNTKILHLYSFCELSCTFYLKKNSAINRGQPAKSSSLNYLIKPLPLQICSRHVGLPKLLIPQYQVCPMVQYISSSLGLGYYSEICKGELSHHGFSLFKYEENMQECTH